MVTMRFRRKGTVLSHLALREVRADCLILRAAQAPRVQQEYQAVICVDPVNFSLMAPEEQMSIFEGYRAYLASRTPADGSICIHVRSSRYDITPYLDQLEHTAHTHAEPGYRTMAASHKQFVEQLAASRVLLARGFWVRISVVINLRERHYRRLTDEERFEQARAELDRNVQSTLEGLNQAGLLSRRLHSQDLVTYYVSCVHAHCTASSSISSGVLETLDFPMQAELPFSPQPDQRALLIPETPPDSEGSVADHMAERAPALFQERRWVSRSRRRIARTIRHGMRRHQHASQMQETTAMASFPDWVSLPELIQPSSLEETPHYTRVHHHTDEYVRARAVIGYPARVYPGWLDQLLAIDEPDIDVLLFIRTLDPARSVRSLGRRLTGYRATQMVDARHGKTENPYIEAARAEVEQLRESLVAKTEQVHAVSLYTLTRAATRQAVRERDQKVAHLLKNMEVQSVALQFEHLPAYLSGVDARDTLQRSRVLPTSVVACLFPFCSNDVSTEPGALVGITPTEGLIFLNPTSPQLENGHVFTIGQSGAGKSLGEKLALMRNLLLGQRAVVIDPDNEYGAIGERFGGTQVTLSPENLRINPFDLRTVGGSRAGLKEKLESLLVLFDLLLADKDAGTLRQTEKGYLHKLLTQTYADRGILSDPRTSTRPVPCMLDVYRRIQKDEDPHGLGERLARYVSSFPPATDVDLDNQLVIFNIKGLKDTSEELLRVGLYLVTEHVWGAVRSLRMPEPCVLLIDTGVDLQAMLAELRKYGGTFALATQSLDYLDAVSKTLRPALLSNIDHLFAFDTGAQDAASMAAEIGEGIDVEDILSLANYTCYAKLTRAGVRLPVFSMDLLPPPTDDPVLITLLQERSAQRFGTPARMADRLIRRQEPKERAKGQPPSASHEGAPDQDDETTDQDEQKG